MLVFASRGVMRVEGKKWMSLTSGMCGSWKIPALKEAKVWWLHSRFAGWM